MRILRLIQEHEIEKIGATSPIKLDVRIIAATHRDLAAMVKAGTFREDLYYRLMVVPIQIPALRERLEDIPSLVEHFLIKFRSKYERGDLTLAQDVLRKLYSYNWPGNIRQLENTVERLVLLTKGSETKLQDFPDLLQFQQANSYVLPDELPETGVDLAEIEKELLVRALRKFDGNQSRAASFLHLSRRTMMYRLEKYRISATEFIRASSH